MPTRVFSQEWQGKDLQIAECVRVANKGLKMQCFCEREQTSGGREATDRQGGDPNFMGNITIRVT